MSAAAKPTAAHTPGRDYLGEALADVIADAVPNLGTMYRAQAERDALRAEVERLRAALQQAVRYVEVKTAYQGAMTPAQVEAAILQNTSIAEVRIGANSSYTLAAFDLKNARELIKVRK